MLARSLGLDPRELLDKLLAMHYGRGAPPASQPEHGAIAYCRNKTLEPGWLLDATRSAGESQMRRLARLGTDGRANCVELYINYNYGHT